MSRGFRVLPPVLTCAPRRARPGLRVRPPARLSIVTPTEYDRFAAYPPRRHGTRSPRRAAPASTGATSPASTWSRPSPPRRPRPRRLPAIRPRRRAGPRPAAVPTPPATWRSKCSPQLLRRPRALSQQTAHHVPHLLPQLRRRTALRRAAGPPPPCGSRSPTTALTAPPSSASAVTRIEPGTPPFSVATRPGPLNTTPWYSPPTCPDCAPSSPHPPARQPCLALPSRRTAQCPALPRVPACATSRLSPARIPRHQRLPHARQHQRAGTLRRPSGAWAARTSGSVAELHTFALPDNAVLSVERDRCRPTPPGLPETATAPSSTTLELRADCACPRRLHPTAHRHHPDPFLVVAGTVASTFPSRSWNAATQRPARHNALLSLWACPAMWCGRPQPGADPRPAPAALHADSPCRPSGEPLPPPHWSPHMRQQGNVATQWHV